MSTSKINVLFLDHTAKLGGGELALLSLTAHLSNNQYRPIVILASDGPLVEMLRTVGVETHVLALSNAVVNTRKDGLGPGSLLKLGQAVDLIVYALKLSRLAKDLNIGLIHTNSLKSDIYGALTGLFAGIPVIWHVRDHINSEYLPNAVAKLFRVLAAVLPAGIVANSASTLSALHVSSRKRTVVAYSGVEDSILDRKEVRPFDAGSPTITLVGRIAEWKGQHVFIEAAAKTVQRYPKARFQIVGAALFGEEAYERSLRQSVTDLALEEHVFFLGFRTDIAELIELSDIVVHASCLGEPFGQVVVQGMAAGKPVIATNGGALPEIVIPGITGLLTPMGDSEALSEAIEALITDPESAMRMGAAGKARVRQSFRMTDTVDAVTGLYDRIVGEEAGGRYANPVFV